MRITFKKACEIIYNHYGRENVSQIRKPDSKSFYIVDFIDGTGVHLTRDDLANLTRMQMGYTLTEKDVEQLIVRYNNAKAESKRLQNIGHPECRFEFGKALALEAVLRMLGFEYEEVSREYWINNDETE